MEEIDLDLLAKFIGRLGSSFIGERAEAARKADEMVRQAGVTWEELLKPKRPAPGPPRFSRGYRRAHVEAAEECLSSRARLASRIRNSSRVSSTTLSCPRNREPSLVRICRMC